MPAPQINDAQLKAVLYRIAQAYLEVERGLRPPEHLQSFLTPYEYRRHRAAPRRDRPRLGPVQMQEMGPVHFQRQGDDKITASLLTRRGADQWGALLLHLRAHGDGWQVDHLERLEHAVKLTEPPEHKMPDPEVALDRRIKSVQTERSLVDAALTATARRIEEIGDRRMKASRQLSEQLVRWENNLSDIDDELAGLRRTRSLRNARTPDLESGESRNSSCGVEAPLGPRPTPAQRARVGEGSPANIEANRQRWDLENDERPPSGRAEDDDRQAHYRMLIEQIRESHDCGDKWVQRPTSAEPSTPQSPDLGTEL